MASKIEICNLALILIGAKPILSLDEQSKPARIFREIWDIARDEVLRDHPWNFAIKRARLSRLADNPTFEYSCAYQLPSDCLRVLQMGEVEDGLIWEVEGRTVVTNEATCQIRYISEVVDTGVFDAKFAAAFAAKLASYAAYPITASSSLTERMTNLYVSVLSGATGADGQEQSAKEVIANALIDARS